MNLSLNYFPSLNNQRRIDSLNHLIRIHDSLMPHQVAVAAGCSPKEGLKLLVFLMGKSLLKGRLLFYHKEHIDGPPIGSSDIIEGWPKIPLVCDICDRTIDSLHELEFDFMFIKTSEFQFIS